MNGPGDAAIRRGRELLATARRVVVFTGAGVSAESGIPTFRDALTGLWASHDPARLATEEGFRADPTLVWDWYAHRRDAVGAAEPNPAHHAIARLAMSRPSTAVVTQNVDGLHQRAGTPDVIELHGSIVRVRCLERCGVVDEAVWRADARRAAPCAPHRCDRMWCGSASCCR